MQRFALMSFSIFLFIITACEPLTPQVDVKKEEAAIRALTTSWFEAESRRDVEACLSLLSPDIIVHPGESPPFSGIDAMRADLEGFFSTSFKEIVPQNRSVFVATAGDLAYDFGEWRVAWPGADGVSYSSGKSTIIWRKFDGKWKCVHLSYGSTRSAEDVSQ